MTFRHANPRPTRAGQETNGGNTAGQSGNGRFLAAAAPQQGSFKRQTIMLPNKKNQTPPTTNLFGHRTSGPPPMNVGRNAANLHGETPLPGPSPKSDGARAEKLAPMKAKELMFAITELSELLRLESAHLRKHDVNAVRELAERKAALSRAYEEQMRTIQNNPELLQSLPEAERETLRSAAETLDKAMKDNAGVLQANMNASKRVLDAVINAVQNADAKHAGYGADGHLNIGPRRGKPRAVSFNEEL